MRRALCVALFVLSATANAAGGRPWIGVAIENGSHGVRVREVFDATPAAKAGLRAQDEVLSVDNQAVKEPAELIRAIQAKGIGEKVALKIRRAGSELSLVLVLEPKPDEVKLLREKLVGKPAPEIALTAKIGPHAAKLAALKGNVVLVEFWETWCGACVGSLPRLAKWHERYATGGLRILGVSPEPITDLARFAADFKVTHTVAEDTGGVVTSRYGVPAIPTFVVIDRAGIVRHVEVGAGERLDALEAAFRLVLEEK